MGILGCRRIGGRAFGALLGVTAALAASPAEADFQPAGALTGSLLFPGHSDLGGGVLVDLGAPAGEFVLGVALGALAISSDQDDNSRAVMPFTTSFSFGVPLGSLTPILRVRAGAWAGATNDGLAAGGFGSAGLHLGISVGGRASLAVGLDAVALLGHGDRLAWAPGLGLVWGEDNP